MHAWLLILRWLLTVLTVSCVIVMVAAAPEAKRFNQPAQPKGISRHSSMWLVADGVGPDAAKFSRV
jgi:hypothetical protein